ncbi:MAG: hypothetical protein ABSH51_21960 [Solirubrobacteraceae bacterium]|jgi:hypothetical protein
MSRVAALAAVGLCASALAGCGGSAATSSVTTQQAHPTPMIPETFTAPTPGTVRKARRATLPSANLAAGGPNAVTPPPVAKPLNPCSLVTNAQAQSIAGAPLRSSREAPLGPTCVFTFTGRPSVTMTIEFLDFASTVKAMRDATRVAIGGFHAECGTLGTQMLDISLSERRVLNVTAPCPVARGFAVRALTRLHG